MIRDPGFRILEPASRTQDPEPRPPWTKCARGDIERRRAQAGVVFPTFDFWIVWGVSAEAERVLKRLNKAVEVNADYTEEEVAARFWRRIGIDIVRGNCRAFRRRLVGSVRGTGWVDRRVSELQGLQVVGGM